MERKGSGKYITLTGYGQGLKDTALTYGFSYTVGDCGGSFKNRCISSESGSSSVEEDEPSPNRGPHHPGIGGGLASFHAAHGDHWPVISNYLPHP